MTTILNRVAMKRAAEIALSYEHERPMGVKFGTFIMKKTLNGLQPVKISLSSYNGCEAIWVGEKMMSLMLDRDIVETCFLPIIIVSELATFIIMEYITG